MFSPIISPAHSVCVYEDLNSLERDDQIMSLKNIALLKLYVIVLFLINSVRFINNLVMTGRTVHEYEV